MDIHEQESLHTHPIPDLRCSPTDIQTWTRIYKESEGKTKYHYVAWFDAEGAMYQVKYDYTGKLITHTVQSKTLTISKVK